MENRLLRHARYQVYRFKVRSLLMLLAVANCTLFSASSLFCQSPIQEYPTNSGMEVAQIFCESLSATFPVMSVTPNCLWYQFELFRTTTICLQTHGASASLIPISEADGTCPASTSDLHIDNVSYPAGTYYIVFNWPSNSEITITIDVTCGFDCRDIDCEGCLPTFMPLSEEKYIVNAWVKEQNLVPNPPLDVINYSEPSIHIQATGTPVLSVDFIPTMDKPVIEGWQMIEGEFVMPANSSDFRLDLVCASGNCLFDDVRVFPADGSMKSYVYDATDLRFVAELDERHFATFYEYDNEGKLIRVKKETERGIMTIQETRQNPAMLTP